MNPALRLGLWVALMIVGSGPLIHLAKVIRVSYEAGAFTFYVGFPVVTLLLLFGGLWEPNRPANRPHLLLALVAFMLISSTLMTVVYEGDTFDIVGNALRLIFVLASMFFLTNAAAVYTAFWNARLLLLSKIFLATSMGATLLMHFAALAGYSVYFGLQTTAAFVPFAYGLVAQRVPLMLLSIVPLIGSGKRGGMLGAFAILLVYVWFAVGRARLGRVVTLAAALSIFTVILYVFQLLPETILSRIDFLFSDADVDLNAVTSGRVVEAAAALERLNSTPFAWLTGFGLGSAVNLDTFGSEVSTIHFSPLAMVMIFGVPLTLLFYSALVYYVCVFFRMCRQGSVSREFAVLYLVMIGELAFSFASFTLLQSYLLWFALAYLIANRGVVAAQNAARSWNHTTIAPSQVVRA